MIEIAWRGYSHVSMAILGGICFLYASYQNERVTWDYPLFTQAIKTTLFILVSEFISGCILNIWLGLGIWDYSHMPFNLFGQVCVLYALLWFPLSFVAIILDDYIRYWFFEEEKPRYKLF